MLRFLLRLSKMQLKNIKSCSVKVFFGFVLFISIFSTNITFGQFSIKGVISDTANYPIKYATIIITKDSSIIASTVSDSMGHYYISSLPAQTYLFTVSYVNTKDWTTSISLTSDTVINAILKEKYNALKAVTVYGQKEFERKADRFIYTPNKSIAEGNSAIDLIRYVPLIQYDEKTNAFSIIGKSGTTVYINNRKTEIPKDMLIEMLRAMPAENIKNVELITNPGSEYTANTSVGVININIKRQLYEGWLGVLNFTTQQGPYNTSILNGYINYRKGKLGIQFNPLFNTSYNYYTIESKLTYIDSAQHHWYFKKYRRYEVFGNGLKLDYDINKKNSLSYNGWFSFVTGKSDATTNTEFSKTGQSAIDSIHNLPTDGKDIYIYNYGNINYHYNIDSSGEAYIDANVDYNHFFQRQQSDWSVNRINTQGAILNNLGQYTNNLPQKFFNISGKLEYSKTFSHSVKFIAGVQLSSTSTDNDLHYYTLYQNKYVLDGKQSLHYHYNEKYYAGFTSLSKSFKKNWNVKMGIRVEGTNYSTQEKKNAISADTNYISLFPNLSIGYSPSRRNQFALNYSRKIKRPNIESLFPGRTYISQNYFSENNSFLQPVMIDNVELSYTSMSKYIFSLTYSNSSNSYNNFTLPIVENGINKLKSTYYNYGNVRSLNFLVNIRQSFFKNFWEFNLTPLYNYSKYYGKTPEVPVNITNHSFNLYFNNNLYISRKQKWTGFVTFRYSSPVSDISSQRLNGISSLNLEIKKVVKKISFNLIFSDVYNGSSKQEKHGVGLNELMATRKILIINNLWSSINSFNP